MARALAITLGVLLGLGGAAWGDKPRIAVLGLEVARAPSGATDPGSSLVAREITRELRDRVQSPASPYALAPNSNKELLDEKALMSCQAEAPECMVVIGAGLAADVLLYGRVDRRGDGFRISVKLLDVRKKLVRPAVDELPGGGGGTAGVSRRLYRRLIADAPSSEGTLVVRARSDAGGAPGGGAVLVDDEARGQLTGGKLTIAGLGEGRHTVAIDVGGLRHFEEIVTIRGGEQVTLEARLHPQPAAPPVAGPAAGPDGREPAEVPGPRKPSPLWKVSLVAGAAAVVGGGSLAWYSYDRQQSEAAHVNAKVGSDRCGDGDDRLRGSDPQINVAAFRRACTWHNRTYVGFGVAALGAAAAIVSLIMLSRDPEPADGAAIRARSKRPSIAIVPVLAPDLAGAQLSLPW